LTGIDLGYADVGEQAARLLDRMLRGRSHKVESVLVPPRGLFACGSTDMVAVDDPSVVAALQFMSRRLGDPINVEDVAAAVSITRRTLERRFRSLLNCSVNEELNRLRLERAKRYLMESNVSIKSVAVECGFGSVTQMGLVFRRFEATTPSEFQRRQLHREP
jgi:LacI family transcriptional regulator